MSDQTKNPWPCFNDQPLDLRATAARLRAEAHCAEARAQRMEDDALIESAGRAAAEMSKLMAKARADGLTPNAYASLRGWEITAKGHALIGAILRSGGEPSR